MKAGSIGIRANRVPVNAPDSVGRLNGIHGGGRDDVGRRQHLSALNSYGYLVARYGSYYAAGRIGSGTGLSAYISRVNADGSSAMLGTPAKVASGNGPLRFVLSGGSLKLFFNNVLVDSATDSTPPARPASAAPPAPRSTTSRCRNAGADPARAGPAPGRNEGRP